MTKKIKAIFWWGATALNGLLLLFCLMACLTPFLHPGNYAFVALLGMGFPLLFAGVFIIALYLIYKKSKWVWLHILVLALGFYQLTSCFGFHAFTSFKTEKKEASLRVLSWNLSSWGVTKRGNTNKTSYRKEMTNLLANSNADVICLQEYHFLREKTIRDSLIPELKEKGYNYFFFARSLYTIHLFKSAHVTGVAIASKFPFADTTHINYSTNDYAEPLIYADVFFNSQRIRIFTTHLQSVRLENYDYEALHNLKEPVNASVIQTRAVAWKLKQAYIKRADQAQILHKKITESPYPVIVCGDFNDVPGSYVYHTIKDNLQDAFLEKGFGFGRTYRFLSPTLRIDYILADKKFTVQQYKKTEANYSDHYPVMADILLDK
jgi:endonuclease/exonuclease/phosphatase family metal-dependent hydrolase